MSAMISPLSTPARQAARPVSTPVPVTVAYGDGIGPEIMSASLEILREAGARLAVEPIEIGEAVYRRGFTAGIEPDGWDSLRRTGVFFKAPVSTPQGGGFKSLNVTIRKTLGLFANVRPAVAYHPFVSTLHPEMDVVIVRENEEDLYAGIEHRQTGDVYQCLKLISRPGCEKIVRFAFDYARRNGRRRVTCFSKDNIMKMTDGLFHKVFDEIAAGYPDIAHDHMIVDIGAARLATRPHLFDVIVTPNLYGDILSDVAAEIAGSVGLAASANVGDRIAMFEAIHGSAPDIAGQGVANPTGLLLSGVMMLVHIGQHEAATLVHNAVLRTLEDGVHTPDVFGAGVSSRRVGTEEYKEAVINRLGARPEKLRAVEYRAGCEPSGRTQISSAAPVRPDLEIKETVGVDVFLHWSAGSAGTLGHRLERFNTGALKLKVITNRGVKVWPQGFPETFCTDHWRCRFQTDGTPVTHYDILRLLQRLAQDGFDFIKTENLYTFNGQPGFSLAQGQ